MTQRIVDVLEVVEIQEHHGDELPRAMCQRQRVLDAVAEQAAVGEQRQRIVERELAQLFLEGLAFTDVAEIEREPRNGRVIEQIATDTLERSEEHTSELQSPCNLVCR